jgi:imidazolonepropionase-like amidohydrolase
MATLRILAAATLSTFVLAGSISGDARGRWWIEGATLVSPERLDQAVPGDVLVEGDRIAAVRRGPGSRPRGVRVVDGRGLFLIPGLIDSHVHLAALPGMGDGMATPELERRYYQQLPRSYLAYGYTTLVDPAIVNRAVIDDFRGSPFHPDLYHCGPSLPVADGYPMAFASPEERFRVFPNWLFDPARPAAGPAGARVENHTPAAAVSAVKAAGGICVKTYFERGFGSQANLPVIGPDLLSQVRASASRDGLVLMMHANSFEAQRLAVDAGVDVIAHGLWNWGEMSKSQVLPEEVKALLDRIVDRRIGYQPTIQVIAGMLAYFDSTYLQQAAVSRVVPPAMAEWFRAPEGRWFRKEIVEDDVPDTTARANLEHGPLRRVRQVVQYLARRDAEFLFGTDTPSAPNYGNLPGLNGYLEMRQLRQAGLSLAQILRAATISNARRFRIDGQVGTIETGKIADLVLLRRNPLEDVSAYDSVATVWLHGRPMARETLAATAGVTLSR